MIETIDAPDMMTDAAPQRQKPGPKPKPTISMDDLAKLIVDSQTETAQQIAALAARVEAAEAKAAQAVTAVPQFVKSEVQTWGNRELQEGAGFAGISNLRAGQEATGVQDRLPITPRGRIPDEIAAMNQPRYGKGQRVRINTEATRHGAERTWAEVLASPKGQQIATVGVIRDIQFLGGQGWKYQCRFAGMIGARGQEDGFYEYELLPA